MTQATTVALALGSAAVQDGLDGDQQLMHETARQLIRVLLGNVTSDASLRARLFSHSGDLRPTLPFWAGLTPRCRWKSFRHPRTARRSFVNWKTSTSSPCGGFCTLKPCRSIKNHSSIRRRLWGGGAGTARRVERRGAARCGPQARASSPCRCSATARSSAA